MYLVVFKLYIKCSCFEKTLFIIKVKTAIQCKHKINQAAAAFADEIKLKVKPITYKVLSDLYILFIKLVNLDERCPCLLLYDNNSFSRNTGETRCLVRHRYIPLRTPERTFTWSVNIAGHHWQLKDLKPALMPLGVLPTGIVHLQVASCCGWEDRLRLVVCRPRTARGGCRKESTSLSLAQPRCSSS